MNRETVVHHLLQVLDLLLLYFQGETLTKTKIALLEVKILALNYQMLRNY